VDCRCRQSAATENASTIYGKEGVLPTIVDVAADCLRLRSSKEGDVAKLLLVAVDCLQLRSTCVRKEMPKALSVGNDYQTPQQSSDV
jgi:hypothetical protein